VEVKVGSTIRTPVPTNVDMSGFPPEMRFFVLDYCGAHVSLDSVQATPYVPPAVPAYDDFEGPLSSQKWTIRDGTPTASLGRLRSDSRSPANGASAVLSTELFDGRSVAARDFHEEPNAGRCWIMGYADPDGRAGVVIRRDLNYTWVPADVQDHVFLHVWHDGKNEVLKDLGPYGPASPGLNFFGTWAGTNLDVVVKAGDTTLWHEPHIDTTPFLRGMRFNVVNYCGSYVSLGSLEASPYVPPTFPEAAAVAWDTYDDFKQPLSTQKWTSSGNVYNDLEPMHERLVLDASASGSTALATSVESFDRRSVRLTGIKEEPMSAGRSWELGYSDGVANGVHITRALTSAQVSPDLAADVFLEVWRSGMLVTRRDLGPYAPGTSMEFTGVWIGSTLKVEVKKDGFPVRYETFPEAPPGMKLRFNDHSGARLSIDKVEAPPVLGTSTPVPIISCVQQNGDHLTAVLGYTNPGTAVAYLDAGSPGNMLTGSLYGQVQPRAFQGKTAAQADGTYAAVFAVDFAQTLTWTLGNTTISSAGAPSCAGWDRDSYGSFISLPGGLRYHFPPDRDDVLAASVVATDAPPNSPAPGPGTSGSIGVSSSGSATYEVPLWVPEGMSGLKPNLSLRYDSRGGNGVVGVGWSLAGVSQIQRCPLVKAAPTKTSSGMVIMTAAAPISFDESTDPHAPTYDLCLNGRPLHAVTPNSLPIRTYQIDDDPRTTIEVTDSDQQGPKTIVLQDGNGMTMTFGLTNDASSDTSLLSGLPARVAQRPDHPAQNCLAYGRRPPSGPQLDPPPYDCENNVADSVRLAWSISRLEDRFGNALTFRYETPRDFGGVSQVLKEIAYTRKGAAAPDCSLGGAAERCVVFSYESRPDSIRRWVGGLQVIQSRRLSRIEARGPALNAPGQTGVLRTYKITYNKDAQDHDFTTITGRSLLTSVEECDGDGRCTAPLRFEWEPGNFLYDRFTIAPPYVGTITAFSSPDLNADGKSDYLLRMDTHWYYALSDGHGGIEGGNWIHLDNIPSGFDGTAWNPAVAADISGDGVPEIGVWKPAIRGYSYFQRQTPTHYQELSGDRSSYLGDFDGDGLADFLAIDPSTNHWAYLLNQRENPGSFGAPIQTELPDIVSIGRAYMANVDGSGRHSLLVREADGQAAGRMWAHRAVTGAAPGDAFVHTTLHDPSLNDSGFRWIFMDYNGDGLGDALAYLNNSLDGPWGLRSPSYMFSMATNLGVGFDERTGPAGQAFSGSPEGLQFDHTPDYLCCSLSNDLVRSGVAYDAGFRVADVNLDGNDDIVSLYFTGPGGPRWIDFSHDPHAPTSYAAGLRFTDHAGTPPFPVDVIYSGSHNAQGQILAGIGDTNGDGIPDIVVADEWFPEADHVTTFQRKSAPADVIKAVVEPLGARSEVHYAAFSENAPPDHAQDCQYPYHCTHGGFFAVTEVKRSTGVTDGYHSESHSFTGARSLVDRRGWLGMGTHTIEDKGRGLKRTLFYDNQVIVQEVPNDQPYVATTAGLVAGESTTVTTSSRTGARALMSQTATIWKRFGSSLPMVIAAESSCTRDDDTGPDGNQMVLTDCSGPSSDEQGQPLPQYDAFANRLAGTRRLGGPQELTAVTMAYDNSRLGDPRAVPPVPRILGVPLSRTVKATVPARQGRPSQEVQRNVEYVPDAYGMVGTEFVERGAVLDEAVLRRTTTIQRDDLGRVRSVRVSGDGSAPFPPGATNRPSVPESAPQVRGYDLRYDDFDGVFPSLLTNIRGDSERFFYHPGLGTLAGSLDLNKVLVARRYDKLGRLIGVDQPHDGDVSIDYLTVGGAFQTKVSVAGGQSETTVHDLLGRAIARRTEGSRGRTITQTFAYDDRGFLVKASHPTFEAEPTFFTWFDYDAAGRPKSVERPDGTTTWDYAGFRTEVTDARSNVAYTLRDNSGRVVESGKGDQVTKFHYGAFGNLDYITLPGAGAVGIQHDRLGRRTRLDDPDLGTRRFGSNSFGDEIHEVDQQGVTESRRFDDLGRLTTVDGLDGRTAFTYDTAPHGKGSVATATSATGVTTEHLYDVLGRATVETITVPGVPAMSVEHQYDSFGRLSRVNYPEMPGRSRFAVDYHYSALPGHHLLNVAGAAGGGLGNYLWQVEDRSPYGGVSQEISGDAFRVHRTVAPATGLLSALVGAYATSTGFDPEVVGENSSPPGVETGQIRHQDLDFGYDQNRNLNLRSDHRQNVNEIYSYDPLDRLKRWTVHTSQGMSEFEYRYDPLGNLTDRAVIAGSYVDALRFEHGFSSSGRHAVTASFVNGTPSGTYTYDDGRGNQTSGPGRTVTYTQFNLPKTITKSGVETTFSYDAFGRRARRATGSNLVAYHDQMFEVRKDGGMFEYVLHVYGEGRRVAEVQYDQFANSEPIIRYLHDDHLGTPETVTFSTTDPVAHVRFDPFGAVVNPGSPDLNVAPSLLAGLRTGFTGHEPDRDFGLTNMKGRMYDPASGHFLSPDPIVAAPFLGQAYNRYAYVLQNPLSLIDPSGFKPEEGQSQPSCLFFVCYTPGSGWSWDFSYSGNNGSRCDHGGCGGSPPPTPKPPSNDPNAVSVSSAQSDTGGGVNPSLTDSFVNTFLSIPDDPPEEWNTKEGFWDGVGLRVDGRSNFGCKTWTCRLGHLYQSFLEAPAEMEAEQRAGGPILFIRGGHSARSSVGTRGRGCPGCPCFVPGTLVLMADGSTRAIEEVKVGDWVLAADPTGTDGETRPYKVVGVMENYTKRVVRIEVEDKGGPSVIEATGEHPFWTVDNGWIAAAELGSGDRLIGPDGNVARIVSVSAESRESVTHNLMVEGIHTYYVVAGRNAVLVHNQTIEDAIRLQAPVDIPANAWVNSTSITQATGAWNINFRWEANGLKYTARFHSPSPGAIAAGDTRNVWIIQRGTGWGNPQHALSETGQWVPYGQHATGQTGTATHLSSRRGGKIPCP
jgi:RHS repeat-associated protein